MELVMVEGMRLESMMDGIVVGWNGSIGEASAAFAPYKCCSPEMTCQAKTLAMAVTTSRNKASTNRSPLPLQPFWGNVMLQLSFQYVHVHYWSPMMARRHDAAMTS
jgi:hypothetical protein